MFYIFDKNKRKKEDSGINYIHHFYIEIGEEIF